MKFAGFALLTAGLAFVFHAYSPSKFDVSRPVATHESGHAVALDARPALRLKRNFAIDSDAAPRPAVETGAGQAKPAAAIVPVVAELSRPTLPQAIAIDPPAPAVTTTMVQAPADDTSNRETMVRRIKRELRRVGCYDGRIDSEWDRTTRSAMGTFMERVNASLPAQEPDVVLLNLVRNHQAMACGASCPSGQAMDGDGRCLPAAIIAMTKRKATETLAQNTLVTKPFTTTLTINEMKPTAATLPPPQPPVHVATRAPRAAPLPGRMTVGGPGTASASVLPPEKSWWDNFIGTATATQDRPREQTLDRPVGLTQVPQPRLVRQSPAIPQPPSGQQRASLEASTADNGTGDGTGLTRAAAETPAFEAPRKATGGRPYRKAARGKPAKQKYARRWNGRNVQVMFQHPLGRM